MNKILFLSVFLLLCAGVSLAQPDIERTRAGQKNPYVEGETLTFEGKYKKFGFAFSIAEMSFSVSKLPGTDDYYIKSEAHSKGTLTKLFNFKFYQRYESTVDADQLQIVKTVKRDEQGDRVRDSQADFDYLEKRVTYVETDPNDPTRPPRRAASAIGFDTQDIVSSVYMLRGRELAVGRTFVFNVSDSGLIYEVPIRITARERKKSILGKKWCWRVEADIFGDGRFIEQKGSFTFWITDDELRIPIRAELETELGDVRIKLKKIQTRDVNLEDDGKDDDDEDDS
jgi:hypothetical protein